MLREKIAKIIYEGYTGLSWPDEDEHLNNAARKHANEILELPEIEQAERMREKVEEVSWNLNQFCKLCEDEIPVCDGCNINHALTILKEADHA